VGVGRGGRSGRNFWMSRSVAELYDLYDAVYQKGFDGAH
jgi:hypothetical protein